MEEWFPILRVAANIPNKQSWTADRGGSPAWGLGEMLTTPLLKNWLCYETWTLASDLDRTTRSEIHTLTYCIWNKKELPEQWKEWITVPIYKKGNKTDCSNYRGISLLSTTYKIVSNILLSKLTPYAKEITGDHQCGFRRSRSTTDHINLGRVMSSITQLKGFLIDVIIRNQDIKRLETTFFFLFFRPCIIV